ncbi:MAG: glycine cleavage system protein T [Rhodobacteraceae bacterium]|nr:glycine cleavage system protein T [Paracoccaceae bacterium]
MIPHKGASLSFQPRIRKGAFFDASWRHGCRRFSVYNRTYIAGGFASPLEEYWQVTRDVALWPVMGERQVEISGPDAADFVQFLTTRDISRCRVGQCKYALITSPEGGILCDPIILRLEEDRFWLSTSDVDLELWAKGVAVHSPMQVKIRDAGVSVIQVQGPKSPRLMTNLFGERLLKLKYYRLTPADFQGHRLMISRTGWSGEFGYEIYLGDACLGDALFDALLQAGSGCNAAPGAVSHARRIESGILSWGVDMTPQENPYEVGLGRLVELDGAPEFVGRAALERMRELPPARRLVGMRIEGTALEPNEDLWPLTRGGKTAGRLTSLAYSPRLQANIALGLVAAEDAAAGTQLVVDTWDGPRKAWVSGLPFLPKRQQEDAHRSNSKGQ